MVDQEIRVLGDENIIANPKNSQKQYPLTFKAVPNVIVYGRKKADLNFTVPITEGTNFNFNLERTAIIFSDSFNLEEYSYIMVKNPFEEISDFFYVSSLEELDPTGKEFNEFNDEVVKWLRRLVNIISNRCMIFETTLFKDLNNFPNIKSGQTFLRTEDGWTGITIRDINSELDLIFNKYVEEINKKIQEHQTQMNELLEQWKKDIQKYAENVKQYEIVRVVTQSGHGFIFEPVMYSISQRKFVKAVFPHGADGIAVRVDDNNFRLVWAGRVEIPSTAKDTQQRDFVLGEYYFLGEGSNGGIQREKPDTYYQHLFQVQYSDELQQNIADVLLSVPINQKGKRWDVGEAKTTVNDIEELKMSDFPVGKVVEVLGYYKAGDGADHKRIISATDDGSGVQLNNGLWANIVHNGEVNVSWFGITEKKEEVEIIQKFFDYSSDKIIDKNFSYNVDKSGVIIKIPQKITFKNSKITILFSGNFTAKAPIKVRSDNVEFINLNITSEKIPTQRGGGEDGVINISGTKEKYLKNIKFTGKTMIENACTVFIGLIYVDGFCIDNFYGKQSNADGIMIRKSKNGNLGYIYCEDTGDDSLSIGGEITLTEVGEGIYDDTDISENIIVNTIVSKGSSKYIVAEVSRGLFLSGCKNVVINNVIVIDNNRYGFGYVSGFLPETPIWSSLGVNANIGKIVYVNSKKVNKRCIQSFGKLFNKQEFNTNIFIDEIEIKNSSFNRVAEFLHTNSEINPKIFINSFTGNDYSDNLGILITNTDVTVNNLNLKNLKLELQGNTNYNSLTTKVTSLTAISNSKFNICDMEVKNSGTNINLRNNANGIIKNLNSIVDENSSPSGYIRNILLENNSYILIEKGTLFNNCISQNPQHHALYLGTTNLSSIFRNLTVIFLNETINTNRILGEEKSFIDGYVYKNGKLDFKEFSNLKK